MEDLRVPMMEDLRLPMMEDLTRPTVGLGVDDAGAALVSVGEVSIVLGAVVLAAVALWRVLAAAGTPALRTAPARAASPRHRRR